MLRKERRDGTLVDFEFPETLPQSTVKQDIDNEITQRTEAKADARLQTLAAMTPVEVRAWVQANVNSLADAKDLLKTIAVVVSILARRL
jgi:transcriptional regulator of nitric oxide reductase